VSDEKLRELERVFQESGSEEAELAWLRELARAGEKLNWESYSRLHELDVEAAAGYLRWRVDSGDLSQERLELAVHADHEAAVLLCEDCPLRAKTRLLSAEPKLAALLGLASSFGLLATAELEFGEEAVESIYDQIRAQVAGEPRRSLVPAPLSDDRLDAVRNLLSLLSAPSAALAKDALANLEGYGVQVQLRGASLGAILGWESAFRHTIVAQAAL
jgi:hypothetical protein